MNDDERNRLHKKIEELESAKSFFAALATLLFALDILALIIWIITLALR